MLKYVRHLQDMRQLEPNRQLDWPRSKGLDINRVTLIVVTTWYSFIIIWISNLTRWIVWKIDSLKKSNSILNVLGHVEYAEKLVFINSFKIFSSEHKKVTAQQRK